VLLNRGIKQPELNVVGLDSRPKQRYFAGRTGRSAEVFDLDSVISRLKEIRGRSLADMDSMVQRFSAQASNKENTSLFFAKDAADAAGYIRRTTGSQKRIAVNRANVVRELKPLLEKNDYRLTNTYLSVAPGGDSAEKVLNHFWQLPDISRDAAFESFTVLDQGAVGGRKDYTALIGVTAAAAQDGSLCFFQHTANIGTMIDEARRLIFVVGIEKIVNTGDDGIFQTKCMGFFGLESLLLDLKVPAPSMEADLFSTLERRDVQPEIHIILLDNGRSEIAGSGFAGLLKCISCRACAKFCPTHKYFDLDTGNYPRAYLYAHLIGTNSSLGLCIGCGRCVLECPLDIDVPALVPRARARSLVHLPRKIANQLTHDAWFMMRQAGRFSPLVNGALDNRLVRTAAEKITGLQRDAWLPKAGYKTFNQRIAARPVKRIGAGSEK